MSESNAKKAAASRGASTQSSDSAPVTRQTPAGAQQQNAAGTAPDETGSDSDADRIAAVTRAEEAADRAEAAADRIESKLEEFKEYVEELAVAELDVSLNPDQQARRARKVEASKEPEIGSPEWQRNNRLAALEEELGFAKAKKQDGRVSDIRAEIARVKAD